MAILRPLLFLFIIAVSAAAFSQELPPDAARVFDSTLQSLIDSALRNNPGLAAADAQIETASAGAAFVRSLDPPLAGVEFMGSPIRNFPNLFRDQMEIDYFVQQMIPYPGKLGAMAEVERKRAEMFRAGRVTREQDIVRQIESGYYELYLIHRSREINLESRDLVRDFIDIARTRYELGRGSLADILRAQTELSAIENDRIVLDTRQRTVEGMLNALAARDVTIEIGFIPEIDPPEVNLSLDQLLVSAETRRPELRSMQANIEMAQAERASAGKESLPDFMVGGSYKQMMDGDDNWGLMVGLTIPLAPWANQRVTAGKARADAAVRQAQAELENMRNMVAAEVNEALQNVESSRARMTLARDTAIPQARETLESAVAGYQTGGEEFLMLIDTQRMLIMAELDYHMAVMNLLDSLSQVERATGTSSEGGNPGTER